MNVMGEKYTNKQASQSGLSFSKNDFVEMRSGMWGKPLVAQVVDISFDYKYIKVIWFYRPQHITKNGMMSIVFEKDIEHQKIGAQDYNLLLCSYRKEKDDVSVDYVIQKCTVFFLDKKGKSKQIANGSADGIPVYYAYNYLAYDRVRGVVRYSMDNL
ncbi:hypothetical protein SUGI_0085800 [Cryptomeria japonica]|nr:hypothetical protein SUGI_0085800 [Cryptomeria japonica]